MCTVRELSKFGLDCRAPAFRVGGGEGGGVIGVMSEAADYQQHFL